MRSHRRQRDLGVTPPDPGGEWRSVKNNDPALIDWFAVSERRCGLQRPVIR